MKMVIKKLSQIDHVLTRPDMYVGGAARSSHQISDFLPSVQDGTLSSELSHRNVSVNLCLFKMFDELLVNARDHSVRDPTVSRITTVVKPDRFAVENDGTCVPIEIDPTEGVYVPELVFGHLLVSSNYDDHEERIVGGRNGLGAKLANIFCSKYVIEMSDGTSTYKQTFSNNMKTIGKPAVKAKSGRSYTKITAFPDWAQVGQPSIDPHTIDAMARRVIDIAATSRPTVRFNGRNVTLKSVKHLAKAIQPDRLGPLVIHETDRWTVAVFVHDKEVAPRIGFVNGVSTPNGTHMQHILGQVVKAVRTKMPSVTPSMISECLGLIVDATIVNPEFSSQKKETLTSPSSKFGSLCQLPDDLLRRISRKGFGLIERLESIVSSKADAAASKSDATSLKKRLVIPKLDDATLAGTSQSSKCTLILTEGDSAKSLAIAGLSVVGRATYGVFPLRGKLINVRDVDGARVTNQEILNLKRIIGLEHKKRYTDVSQLRYGRVLIMTDADHDGSHIKGLILNFFDAHFPELVAIPGFVAEFITPLVKVRKGTQTKSFFSMEEYRAWEASTPNASSWQVKYYKGLGTSTSLEAREYFRALNHHTITFRDDESRRESLSLAFSKKRADDRKRWIQAYDETAPRRRYDVPDITVTDFINRDLICFSRADVTRSIPSMCDGLKPSQRKIIYAAFCRKLESDIKVAQFAGYVAEKAAYHHGEASLQSTIVGLAREYVGSNNVPLLVPSGQFGTRIAGGSDAASARYIFTRLSDATRHIFPAADDPILSYLTDDGQRIEPSFYVPIIPMALVNGVSGIGTGFSSFIPCYNPLEIIANLQGRLDGKPFSSMTPWYRGFTGSIRPMDNGQGFVSVGTMTRAGKRVHVTELPVGCWTQSYKEYLLEHHAKVVDDSTEERVDISFECVSAPDEHALRLVTRLPTTNMVLFDSSGQLKRYASVEDILEDFYTVRLRHYEQRKAYQLKTLETTIGELGNKLKFVTAVEDGSLVLLGRAEGDILRDMEGLGITRSSDLLNMRVRALTKTNVEQLKASIEDAECTRQTLEATSPEQIWHAELETLSRALQ